MISKKIRVILFCIIDIFSFLITKKKNYQVILSFIIGFICTFLALLHNSDFFSKEFIKRVVYFDFGDWYVVHWYGLIKYCFLPIYIEILSLYFSLSIVYYIIHTKDKFFIKNFLSFSIFYCFTQFIIHTQISFYNSSIPILISIFIAFLYNLVLLFWKKKYCIFFKIFFVLLNYIFLFPIIILAIINFFPYLFNLFFINDFFGDKIFELAEDYKSFVIVSIIFTILFQLYLWVFHDKLADKLSSKGSLK